MSKRSPARARSRTAARSAGAATSRTSLAGAAPRRSSARSRRAASLLDEHRARRAARDGLDADGAGARVEVEHARARHPRLRAGRRAPARARPDVGRAAGGRLEPAAPSSARRATRTTGARPRAHRGGSGGANWKRSSSILIHCEYGSLTPSISTTPVAFSRRATRKTCAVEPPQQRARAAGGPARSARRGASGVRKIPLRPSSAERSADDCGVAGREVVEADRPCGCRRRARA